MSKEPENVHLHVAGAVPDTICFVGDSITLGWGDEALGGWPARLLGRLSEQGYQVTGYNLGVRGDTSSAILGRWQDEVGRRRRGSNPLLVFAFGVNDAKIAADGTQPVHPDLTARNTRQILADAGTGRTLMIGPTPIDEAVMQKRLNSQRRVADAVASVNCAGQSADRRRGTFGRCPISRLARPAFLESDLGTAASGDRRSPPVGRGP